MMVQVAIICAMILGYTGMICSLVEISRLVDSVWVCWFAGALCTVGVGALIHNIIFGDI